MPLIGLGGGYASGKSSVGRLLQEMGAVLFDCDKIARQVVEPGAEGLEAVIDIFGPSVLDHTGALDREALGSIVFSEVRKRKALEKIVHPLIRRRLFEQTDALFAREPKRVAVVEAALLFEGGLYKKMDASILVTLPKKLQKERGMKRDRIDAASVEQRIAAQAPLAEKRALADYVIDNSGAEEELKQRVGEIWNALAP